MSINFSQNAILAPPSQPYLLSQLVTVAPGSLPEYLVLTGLDLNRYTAASTGAVGSLTGNGSVATFVSNAQTDGAENIGMVFTYTSNGYYSQQYGYLASLSYLSSTDSNRSEYLSLYGYGTAGVADAAQSS